MYVDIMIFKETFPPFFAFRPSFFFYTNYVICDQTDKDACQCSQTSSRLKNRLNRASYLVSSPICGLKPHDRSMFYLTWKSTLQ